MEGSIISILEEYDKNHSLYSDFTTKFETLINELLKQYGFRVHSVCSRSKNKDSLKKKITNQENKYNKLNQITDLSGIRIITYFNNDVYEIAEMIKKEFDIDLANSIDKSTLLDPDRFGYLSLHYVVKLKANRAALSEYKRFLDFKIEIQVRSILQHAWAEIEHDLGYKSSQAIPQNIKRRFSRLAGLLEIADDEFIKIRDTVKEYEKELPSRIDSNPESVLIDKLSLLSFCDKNELVAFLDGEIVSCVGAKFVEDENDTFDSVINCLKFMGFKTIEDVHNALKRHKNNIINFAKIWLNEVTKTDSNVVFAKGVSIFYLCYVLIGKTKSPDIIFDHFVKFLSLEKDDTKELVAKQVISTYEKIEKT